MKARSKFLFFQVGLVIALFLSGCGGGSSDSSPSSGAISMNVTDAKPVLPSGATKVLVTFDEVSVHSSGGGWTTLAMPQSPFTIDLLQFSDGNKTQLVPPVQLTSGHYTQIRLGVSSATITINGVDQPLEIPSDNLKTVQEFDFTVTGGGAVDLTVDFDLSQSIVATGSGTYQLKPVLHIVQTQQAATINGKIGQATFGANTQAIVVVTLDKDNSGTLTSGDEEYTRITVDKAASGDTQFSVFWLVPNNAYIVQIEIGGTVVYTEAVPSTGLTPGAVFSLKNGGTI